MSQPYRALARKYRPQLLKDLVGQDLLVQTLSQGIQSDQVPHAILLHGIRGVGKTTTARIIARAVNCLDRVGVEPCGKCTSCIGITEDRHLDVIEMDAASHTSVDDVREIIESVRYKAVTGRFKIFIIDEVHMLSKSAFNALLKTLEEPPAHVKFIFATTEIRKIPETILSRCMRFDLKRISPQQIVDHLRHVATAESFTIDDDALALLARAGDGSMRDSLSLLDQALMQTLSRGQTHVTSSLVQEMLGLCDRGQLFEVVTALFKADVADVLAKLQAFQTEGVDALLLLTDILDCVYWLTCLKTAPLLQKDILYAEADRIQGAKIVESLPESRLLIAWQLLLGSYEDVQRSPLPHETLQMLCLRLCYTATLPPISSLLNEREGTTAKGSNSSSAQMLSAMPATFEALLDFLKAHKEPLLATQLMHDVRLVAYKPGRLVLNIEKTISATLLPILRQTLKQLTEHEWIIELSQEAGEESIAQQLKAAVLKKEEEALTHPFVVKLREAFSDAKVHILKKELH